MFLPQTLEIKLLRPASWSTFAAMMMLVMACSESDPTGGGPGGPDPTTPADVNQLVSTLPSWSEFSPPVATANDPIDPSATNLVEETVPLDIGGMVENVTYVCTETEYSMSDTPSEIVMYSPNASIMWVGNLLQGKSYADGLGSFLELSIRQRSPMRLSIDLLTGDNFAVVDSPSLTTVQSAIGALIQRASDAGHVSGSSIDFESSVSHSVKQAALEIGISGRYLGGSAEAELNVQRNASQTTMMAHFVQKMFTISIELPQTPGAMFNSDFTAELLQQQVSAGNIGRDNLPVYIASVTYGRTLTYSLTSSHSQARMSAAISASFNGVVGGASGYTEAELRETLDQQNIKVQAIGGDAQNVIDLISTGNLKSYFTTDADLTSARPLSYQINNLDGANTLATVGETTEYTLRQCTVKPVNPGRYDYLPIQEFAAQMPVPYDLRAGDVDNDTFGDLIWNHRTAATNQIRIGHGSANGLIAPSATVVHPGNPAGGWGNFDVRTGDFNNDQRTDILWNHRGAENRSYLALSQGGGAFTFTPEIVHPAVQWSAAWLPHVGDVNGDGNDDIIWNLLNSAGNAYFVALSKGDGTFDFLSEATHAISGWSPYITHLGDVDGDGWDDLIWRTNNDNNRMYVGRSNGDGTFTHLGSQNHGSGPGWSDYTRVIGNFNDDNRVDLLWAATARPTIPIHRVFGQASGQFKTGTGFQSVDTSPNGPFATYVGDINGDGRTDLLWNRLNSTANHIWVGLANVNGTFDFSSIDQEHSATNTTAENWAQFAGGVVVIDVTGDGRADVVWNERGVTNRVYVAVAKASGS